MTAQIMHIPRRRSRSRFEIDVDEVVAEGMEDVGFMAYRIYLSVLMRVLSPISS